MKSKPAHTYISGQVVHKKLNPTKAHGLTKTAKQSAQRAYQYPAVLFQTAPEIFITNGSVYRSRPSSLKVIHILIGYESVLLTADIGKFNLEPELFGEFQMRLAVLLVLLLCHPSQSKADLIAYESFDYTPNNELVQTIGGGFGFVGNWQTGSRNTLSSTWRIGSTGLDYESLQVDDLSVYSVGSAGVRGAKRSTAIDFVGDSGKTSYMSFLVRRNGSAGAFGGFGGIYIDGANNDELFIGKGGQADT